MRNFRELEVWKIGFEIMLEVYQISKSLPNEEKYGLGDQIRRASVSIPSNIAEGCGRSGERDFKRYPEIAIGSSFELETQLLAIQSLKLAEHDIEKLCDKINLFQRKLNEFISSIKSRLK
ncbi:MAG: four helix bundle protein [Bacteroidota bacterium]